jgi:hypothetical protein
VALAIGYTHLCTLVFRFAHPDVERVLVLGSLACGAATAMVAAVIAWRHHTTRSSLGTLRHVLD